MREALGFVLLALLVLIAALLAAAAYLRHRRERDFRRGHSNYSRFDRRGGWFR